jgi:rubrerythrin
MEHALIIDILKRHVAELNEDDHMYENGHYDVVYALETYAIPAIEKEICKDITLEVAVSGRHYYACPNCNDFLRWRHGVNSEYEPGRCPSCGQSLKWKG